MIESPWQYDREMPSDELKAVMVALGMKQTRLGRFLGFSPRQTRRFVRGEMPLPPASVLLLRSMLFHGERPIVVPPWQRKRVPKV